MKIRPPRGGGKTGLDQDRSKGQGGLEGIISSAMEGDNLPRRFIRPGIVTHQGSREKSPKAKGASGWHRSSGMASGMMGSISGAYSGMVKRHAGYREQPQNCFPAPGPLLLVLNTISASHLGQSFRVSFRISRMAGSFLADLVERVSLRLYQFVDVLDLFALDPRKPRPPVAKFL